MAYALFQVNVAANLSHVTAASGESWELTQEWAKNHSFLNFKFLRINTDSLCKHCRMTGKEMAFGTLLLKCQKELNFLFFYVVQWKASPHSLLVYKPLLLYWFWKPFPKGLTTETFAWTTSGVGNCFLNSLTSRWYSVYLPSLAWWLTTHRSLADDTPSGFYSSELSAQDIPCDAP